MYSKKTTTGHLSGMVYIAQHGVHRLFKRSFLKEPFRKEREKKNCRFIVNHASKWRHHGSFQIFFTPPFSLDAWVMMLFYAWVCSPVEFQVKTLLTSSLRQSRAWWLILFLCFWLRAKSSQQLTNYSTHTTNSWNIKWHKCAGISGLWVLNEIIQKKISWKYEKNRGSHLEVTC